MDATLTEYERKRQERIAKNRALIRDLDLEGASLASHVKKRKVADSSSTSKSKRKPPQPKPSIEPIRRSLRVKGVKADSEKLEEEYAKRRQEEEEAAKAALAAKRKRVHGDLNLTDITSKNNWLWDEKDSDFKATLPNEELAKVDKDVKGVQEQLGKLSLWQGVDTARIKITDVRAYSIAFHPTTEKALVFCADKEGHLGIFDSSQSSVSVSEDDEELELNLAIKTMKPHTRTISGVAFNNASLNAVFTCSYDGTIRKTDLQKQISSEALILDSESGRDNEAFTWMQFVDSEPNLVYWSTIYGWVGIHDLRSGSREKSSTQFFRLSETKIGGFSFHHTEPHLLSTASLDRTIRLWDMRMISGNGKLNKLPHMVGENPTRLSVSNASFNSLGQVAAASYDDTIKIYDFSKALDSKKPITLSEQEMKPVINIPHNNQTGKWVTVFKAHWQPHPWDGVQKFCIPNMDRSIDVYNGKGIKVAKLSDSSITAVPGAAAFHPRMDWVAGATGSGKLCLWVPPEF